MSDENNEVITDELKAQMKEEAATLSPQRRKAIAEVISEIDKPSEPAPDYAHMSQAEFNKILGRI